MKVGGNQVDYWKIYIQEADASLSVSKSIKRPLVLLKCWEDESQTTMVLTQEEAETVAIALLKTAGVADRERLLNDIKKAKEDS